MSRAVTLSAWVCAAFWLLLGSGCHPGPARPFPLGIYGVPKAELPIARAAGFNLVAGPAERGYLNAAQQVGLRVLASPGTSAGTNFASLRARAVVGAFDRHPGLWAWYLVDEPDLNGVSPDQVNQAHRFIKRLGATKPTALVLYQGGEALHYANLADITMVDRYPVPWLPLANFPQHVRMARLALPKDKPLIAVIQAFDWKYYPKLLPDEKNLRPPTAQELRCMTYCALARGATGIFFYCFDDGSWKLPEHPAVWEGLKSTVAEINARKPLFEAEHIWWSYVHDFPLPSTGFNAALESSVIPALLEVRCGTERVPAGQYLLAVNNTERKLTYRITWPPGAAAEVDVLDEGRTMKLKDEWLEDEFGPFDVHIYGPFRRS